MLLMNIVFDSKYLNPSPTVAANKNVEKKNQVDDVGNGANQTKRRMTTNVQNVHYSV